MEKNSMYTTKEASVYLKLSEQHVRRLYNRGKLIGYRPNGGKIYFELEELNYFLRRNKNLSEQENLKRSLIFKKF
jgi:DNA binding domain, excisionase family